MKVNSPALILYLLASVFAVVGVVFGSEFLVLLAKPVIAPAIFFHYLQIKKTRINWLFFIAVLCSFIADMIVVFQMPEGDIPVAFFNIAMYLIFSYFVINDIEKEDVIGYRFFYFILIFLGCFGTLSIILNLMTSLDSQTFNVFIFYGVVLSFLSAIIGFNHINAHNIRTFYALIMCICFVISDVFFAVYNFYLKMDIFILFNVTAQFASYFYMVKYFTSKPVSH